MKFPADQHYAHLDPDEPIPEIEPRINQDRVRATRLLVRVLVVEVILLFAFHFVSSVFRFGLAFTIAGNFVIYGIMMIPLIRIGAGKNLRAEKATDQWGLPIGLQIRSGVVFLLFIMTFPLMIGGSNSIDSFLFNIGLYGFVLGCLCALSVNKIRHPGQICCERCDYPLVGLTLPCSCPECGRALLNLSFATDRPRYHNPRLRIACIALAVLSASLVAIRFLSPGLMYAPIPRSAMIPLAARDHAAFDQFMNQKPTPEESQRLLDAMINARTWTDYQSSFAQNQWLAGQIQSGALTQQQLDTVFAPSAQIWIDAPASSKLGRPIEFSLAADYVRMPDFATNPGYYFEGFTIDGSDGPHAGSNGRRFRLYITDQKYTDKDAPRFRWTPLEPGTHQISARIVLAVFPGGQAAAVPIDWSQPADSMFTTPPIWMQEINPIITVEILE